MMPAVVDDSTLAARSIHQENHAVQVMRIYITNLEFPPISGPGTWRILGFARHLSLAGHEVTVFCSDRSSWHERTDPTLLELVPPDVRVCRIQSTFLRDIDNALASWGEGRAGGLRLLFGEGLRWRVNRWWPDHAFFWALKAAWRAVTAARRDRPDAIISTGPPHISHLVGYLCRTLTGTPWVMDYRDPWTGDGFTEQVIDGPYQSALFRRLEDFLLARADAVVAVSPSWREMLMHRGGGDPRRFHLIRNGQDLDRSMVASMAGKVTSGRRSALHVHFNGTVQRGNDVLGPLVTALRWLRDRNGVSPDSFRFSFCGLRSDFLDRPEVQDVRRAFFDYGALSHPDSIRACLDADCLLVMVHEGGPMTRGVIPGKIYELLVLDKPILAFLPRESDTRDLLVGHAGTVLSDDTSADALVRALEAARSLFSCAAGKNMEVSPDEPRVRPDLYSRATQASELEALVRSLPRRMGPPLDGACEDAFRKGMS